MIFICTLWLIGCGSKESQDKGTNNADEQQTTNNAFDLPVADDSDANYMFDASDIMGSVTEFYKDGCVITPTISEEGGQSARISSSEDGDPDTNVTIQYQDNCIFQIIKVNRTNGKATYFDATLSDIKKQTKIVAYGDFQGAHKLIATKVLITQYE